MQSPINSLLELEFAALRNCAALFNATTLLSFNPINAHAGCADGCERRHHEAIARGAVLDDRYGRRHTDVDVERL